MNQILGSESSLRLNQPPIKPAGNKVNKLLSYEHLNK